MEQQSNKTKNRLSTQQPCLAGLVYKPEDYVYSSATDYADLKGLIDTVVVLKYLNSISIPTRKDSSCSVGFHFSTRKDSCGSVGTSKNPE